MNAHNVKGSSKQGKTLEEIQRCWESLTSYFGNVTSNSSRKWSEKEIEHDIDFVRNLLRSIVTNLREERDNFDWTCSSSSALSPSLYSVLPPSYVYLFGSEDSLDREILCSLHEEHVSQGVVENKGNPKESSYNSIGDVFILTLCQYVKLNMPFGVSNLILEFFALLWSNADIPYLHLPNCPGSLSQSILQINSSASMVPLLDMMLCVGSRLNPRLDVPVFAFDPEENSTQANRDKEVGRRNEERLSYCKFLCSLCEAVQRVPQLADLFVLENDSWHLKYTAELASPTVAVASGSHSTTVTASVPITGESFILLDELIPFLVYESVPDSPFHNEGMKFALSGVVALAKCSDPWVQTTLASSTFILKKTVFNACMILVTLSKLPSGVEVEFLLPSLLSIVQFWNNIYVTMPSLTRAWDLQYCIEHEFIFGTIFNLLQSNDTRVFAATCVVVSKILKCIGEDSSSLAQVISKAILATPVISKRGGQISLQYGNILAFHQQYPGGLQNGPDTSFFDYFIVLKLTENPKRASHHQSRLAEEELSTTRQGHHRDYPVKNNSQDHQLGRWLAVESALLLINALILYSPTLFLMFALIRSKSLLEAEKAEKPKTVVADNSHLLRFPHLNLDQCFSKRILIGSHGVFANSQNDIAQEVLEKLLMMESNTTVDHQAARLCSHNVLLNKLVTLSDSGELSDLASKNLWYSNEIQESPVIQKVCHLFLFALELPNAVLLKLTEVLCSLCLLPDERVLCTLMDPEYGRLDHALMKLRMLIETQFDTDDDAMFAAAAAAAKVAEDTKRRVNSKALRAAAADLSAEDVGISARRLRDASLVSEVTREVSSILTREYLYRVFVEHYPKLSQLSLKKNPKQIENIVAETSLNKEVVEAVQLHKNFLDKCLFLELFRHELDATISHMTFSFKLFNLKPE